MAQENLLISDPDLVAEFARSSAFESIKEKRLVVPPDHMALLMRNGELVDVYRGANFSVGGMLARIRSVFGGKHSFSLLLATLKPFSAQLDFRMITKDSVEVAGMAHLEMQVDPEKPGNILGMMSGRLPLSRDDVLRRIAPHFSERVFGSIGARPGGGARRSP